MPSEMQLSRSIRRRVAIVTGAGSGMGRATAALLLAEGASVVAVDRDGAGLQALADSLSPDAALHTVVADLVTVAAPTNIVDAAHQAFGPVDILINAAGVSFPVELGDEGFAEAWRLTFAHPLRTTGGVHTRNQ